MTAAPILIAGAGPVGLSLGLALVRQGCTVTILERHMGPALESRAETLQPPTLAMLDEWGVLDDVAAHSRQADRVQYWDWLHHVPLAEFGYALLAGEVAHPYRLHCPQPVLCELLTRRLLASGSAELLYGHELQRLEQDDQGVTAAVATHDGGGPRELRGAFLCGADGLGSRVRQLLGVGFQGESLPESFLSVEVAPSAELAFVRAIGRAGLGLGPVAYLLDDEGWTLAVLRRDVVRLMFVLHHRRTDRQGEALQAMQHGKLDARVAATLGERVPVLRRSAWTAQQRVAERFRVGRVLLLGDAAHSVLPVAGTAMNCGIHDAHALAGAIASTLRGGAPVDPLDDWERTRRDAASLRVQLDADQTYRVLAAQGPWEPEARARYLRETASDPALARHHLRRLSLLDDPAEGAPRYA